MRKQTKKISVITVVYNGKNFIEQSILSVITQNYDSFEYIIIDGGSTDGTLDIIDKYKDNIDVFLTEADDGIYDAMNKGIRYASGEFVYFLGADDSFVDENILKQVGDQLKSNIDALSGSVWFVDPQLGYQKEYTNYFTKDDVDYGYCIPHQGIFLRRNILEQHSFNQLYKSSSDREMFYYIYLHKRIKFEFIDLKIAFFSMDGTSANIKRTLSEDWLIMGDYGFSVLNRIIYCINAYLMKYRRGFLIFLSKRNVFRGIFLKIKISRGWIRHFCNNENCRWCKNINYRK